MSIVNRGVPYTFRLAVPHCANCADTAKRKRLGWLGLTAIFLASLVTIAVGVWFVAESQGRTGVGAVAFLVGVVATLRITIAAAKFRRPRPGQASAHQAVYATGVDVEFSGAPKGAILTFANDIYAGKFMAANRSLGVVPR